MEGTVLGGVFVVVVTGFDGAEGVETEDFGALFLISGTGGNASISS